jgi:hypothetical protein
VKVASSKDASGFREE